MAYKEFFERSVHAESKLIVKKRVCLFDSHGSDKKLAVNE